MDYLDFYYCAVCEFHFVDGDPKYINPKQYEDCSHSHMEKVDGRVVCLRFGLSEEKEKEARTEVVSNKCVHGCFVKYKDIELCPDCGIEGPIVFPPSWYWETKNKQQTANVVNGLRYLADDDKIDGPDYYISDDPI